MKPYPPITSGITRYAIGFVVESAEHDLEQLTRSCCDDPVLHRVLVDEGSSPELPRLKTAVTSRRKSRDLFGRAITCCELHVMVNEGETAEQVFGRVTEALARHGWSTDGGPA